MQISLAIMRLSLAISSADMFVCWMSALAAARALIQHTNMSAEEIAKESLMIASEICIYTNDKIVIETL